MSTQTTTLNIKVYETLFILTHIISTLTRALSVANPQFFFFKKKKKRESPGQGDLDLVEGPRDQDNVALQQASVWRYGAR